MSDQIRIFDTSLRDGEQAPGFTIAPEGKLLVAQQLARLGVDVIEAGFPISSPGDFASVQEIARQVRGPAIAGLARANRADIESVARAIAPAARPRIHTVIATSPIHMDRKLRKSPAEVVAIVKEMVGYAASFGMEVEFSAEDATRSDPRFLMEVFSVATQAGATVLNVPDTVGYTSPKEYYDLFRYLVANVNAPRPVTFSCHCHDDLGLAVANTLAAIEAGARQVEGTINGIGERAGNAALEEVVMALHTRQDRYGYTTGIKTEEIYRTSRLLQSITGVAVQPNKAIIGANAFAHESGIHQDGVLKDRQTYEIMKPEDVGVPQSSLVLGKHSGRHALRERLKHLGYTVDDGELSRLFARFKEVADKKKAMTDHDLEALVGDEQQHAEVEPFRLHSFQVFTGTHSLPMATVQVIDVEGSTRQGTASGDGPVAALFHAFDQATDFEGHLVSYQIKAVTDGEDAMGEATVQVRSIDRLAVGRGASTDVLEASVRAYAAAANRLLTGRQVVVFKANADADGLPVAAFSAGA